METEKESCKWNFILWWTYLYHYHYLELSGDLIEAGEEFFVNNLEKRYSQQRIYVRKFGNLIANIRAFKLIISVLEFLDICCKTPHRNKSLHRAEGAVWTWQNEKLHN